MATLGPATDDPAVLRRLVEAGVDVVRVNLAHGALDAHRRTLDLVRATADEEGRTVATLVDLPGPKARTGPFPEGGVTVAEGELVDLAGDGASGEGVVAVGDALLAELRPGDTVVLGDGSVTLEVVDGGRARVVTGGALQGRPGVAIRPERVPDRSPTPDDLRHVEALRGSPVDFLAVSFVRAAADVEAVRTATGPDGPALVAKIETAEAVDDLDAILGAADAVMVARGDLGIRVPLEDVPHLQRRIVRSCVDAARPVITATQMLESMVRAPTPTRAEVADVAAAVEDGTDALMLSGETAVGHDPVAVVRTMATVAARAEAEVVPATRLPRPPATGPGRVADAIAAAAWRGAADAAVAAIVCWTRTGTTARAVARLRPAAPLVGLTASAATGRRLALTWGVVPVVDAVEPGAGAVADAAVGHARRLGLAGPGDVVAVVAAASGRPGAPPDLLHLLTVP